MKSIFYKLSKIRGLRLAVEILVIFLIYILLKTWMQHSMIEGTLPEIEGKFLDGQPFNMSLLQGKPSIIYFWASWCGICKLEQGIIEDISKEHNVISIAMKSGDKEKVRQFMRDNNLSFPVLNDPTGALAARFGVRGVPASFILGPDGEIRFKETGYTTNWGLRIRLWLAEN